MHQPRHRLSVVLLPFALASALGASATPASAGTWTDLVCNAAGTPAPIGGMAPSAAPGTLATNACNLASGGGLISAVTTSAAPGAAATWTYTAPANSTITGGAINLQLFAPPGAEAYISTPGPLYDPTDVIAGCGPSAPCGPGAVTQTISIPNRGATRIYETALCPTACPPPPGGGGLFASINVFALAVQLTNNAVPAATTFAGPLTGVTPVSGVTPLSFAATDPGGPGIYSVSVLLDSTVAYAATPDINGGACASVGKDPSGALEFISPQPCAAALPAISIPVDTTKIPDGSHDLRVYVEDAAQNVSLVLDKAVTIANAALAAPTPTPAPPVHPCTLNPQRAATLSFKVRALSGRRLHFTGSLHDPYHCALGAPASRPLVLIEDKAGRRWQDVVTARVSSHASFTATYKTSPGSVGGRFTFRAVLAQTPVFKRAESVHRRVLVHQ